MISFVPKRMQQLAAPDAHSPDEVARRFPVSLSRRRACQALSGGALGTVLAGLGLTDVLAGCRGVGERCRRKGQCCSGRCRRNKCRRRAQDGPQIDPPPPGFDLPPSWDNPPPPPEHRRRVVLSGTMEITDDETFGSDERCTYRLDDSTAVLTPADSRDDVQIVRGCGGEVRVELSLSFWRRDNGDVAVWGRLVLFEGTSESTSDRDGDQPIGAFDVRRDSSVTRGFTVHNEDEGGDDAIIRLTFRNVAA
jgi:hypothetical protein